MKMVRTAWMSDRDFISCIQKDNNNKTKVNFQEEYTDVLEKSGINRIGSKQAKK